MQRDALLQQDAAQVGSRELGEDMGHIWGRKVGSAGPRTACRSRWQAGRLGILVGCANGPTAAPRVESWLPSPPHNL